MANSKTPKQKQTKPAEPKVRQARSSQQKSELSPVALPDLSGQISPGEFLTMQQRFGNQATQRFLQRYRDNAIQREDEEESEAVDETPESTIVFSEEDVDPIVVKNPWTSAKLSADPSIKAKDQGKKTVVKGGAKFAKKSEPFDYRYSFTDDTVVETKGKGRQKYFVARKRSSIKDVSAGMPDKWKRPFVAVQNDFDIYTGVTPVKLPKSKRIRLSKFNADSKDWLIRKSRLRTKHKKYVLLKIGDTEYHANKEDLFESKAEHKETDDPLFPDGAALPEHIKQTGLGDCYLQAFLINVAVQNPGHLTNMMFDDGEGNVTVRYYFKNGASWDPEFIKIKKSIATGATGDKLYNDGALWAHIIEKSFTVFAGKHGMYGDALSPPANKGYGAIEGGWTYQLGGVFYGKASKEATLENMAFDTDMAKMLKANYDQIKKLYQFKSSAENPYLDNKEAVMLTASASWFDTLKRIITVAKKLESSADATSDLGKGIKKMRELSEAAKSAAEKPENSNKNRMDIPEVVTAVKKSKDYVVGEGAIGKAALANADKALLNRFYELLNNFKELGSDSSPNQRFIYNHHAYSVVDVGFKDTEGADYMPSKADLDDKKDEVLQKLDSSKTTVTLRNPHKTNTPTQNAKEEAPGKFTISLDQFLTSFTRLEYGRVEKS